MNKSLFISLFSLSIIFSASSFAFNFKKLAGSFENTANGVASKVEAAFNHLAFQGQVKLVELAKKVAQANAKRKIEFDYGIELFKMNRIYKETDLSEDKAKGMIEGQLIKLSQAGELEGFVDFVMVQNDDQYDHYFLSDVVGLGEKVLEEQAEL